jgi:hypothetical protein
VLKLRGTGGWLLELNDFSLGEAELRLDLAMTEQIKIAGLPNV